MADYHVSVLLEESVNALKTRPEGTYIDVTFGAGGHSRSILKNLNAKGRLFGFDQDADVLPNVPEDNRFELVSSNFRFIARFMDWYGVGSVDGILADLGVSSHQLDFPERGFSFRYDAELDMRMNAEMTTKAADVLRHYREEELIRMFSDFGEVRNARQLSRAIIKARTSAEIRTTFMLNQILEITAIGPKPKYFAQVYQALRMEVNDEIGALRDMLKAGLSLLKPGGRFVVITYHSIEDRQVKNFFKTGRFDGIMEKDEYGRIFRPFDLLDKKVFVPEEKEIIKNPRARSAKMRVVEKI